MAPSPSGFAFDVFLSFRGEDTLKNFMDHLYTALVNAQINTFRDDRLEKEKVIKEELDDVIRHSRSSVIVLSKEYVSSTWCLDELVMILQQRKRTSDYVVLPVFYDVDPSQVRKQTGAVARAFTLHQKTQSSSKLKSWRTTLKEVADLAGMNLQTQADGNELKFIQNIVREIQDKLGRKPLSDVQEELKKKLRYAYRVLNVAEGKQLNNPTVREWLFDLKDVVYDAEDLLQEIQTEMLRQEMEEEYEYSTSKAQELISTSSHGFDPALVYSMVDQVLERLDNILKQTRDVLDLELIAGSKVSQTIPSTSLVEDFGVCGREDEMEKLIRLLLSIDESGNKINVIPVVGMGGLGKTTLAQLLYNDDRVEQHFDIQAWAYVSEKFDVLRISQKIYESLTSNACNIVNLDMLQSKLKEAVKGKKIFFVLDDMWNKSYTDWNDLKRPFQYAAHGSKIIVTTRNQDVACMMCTLEPHSLMPMSEEEGWSLFEKHAFKNAGVGAHSDLEEIGRKIVKKCKGLPLAIKSLGGLLCSKLIVREWESILNSEMWELPQEESNILPSLWLSYQDLTLELKRCFEYCSIFPKNYMFKRFDLILLWKAEGLLEPDKRKSAEEIGEDYFKDLISRSFFQLSSTDYDSLESYTMHDFHNDLASFVSGEFCLRLEGNDSPNIWTRTRHVNVKSTNMFEGLHPPKRLRTLISEASYQKYLMVAPLMNLLPKLQCLRVLKLSRYPIKELPDTINNLKHLKQLDLSDTRIRRLPDTICTLYNLQALLLSECYSLTELPANLGRLIKLSHLDITRTQLKRMPQDMGNLKDLQMLTEFVLDKDTARNNLKELKKLQNLRGSLRISGLGHSSGLKPYILRDKKFLNQLVLLWEEDRIVFFNDPVLDWGGSEVLNNTVEETEEREVLEKRQPRLNLEREVLEKLQPHLNLERLTIRGFGGKMLADWSGYYSSSALVHLELVNCENCVSLPALGQLPCLRELIIFGLHKVVSIDSELYYGEGSATTCVNKPFRSLQSLEFSYMNEWKVWSFVGGDHVATFPKLTKLSMDSCPKLSLLPESMYSHLPSLVELTLLRSPELECYPEGGFPSKLKSLVIRWCKKLNAKSVQKLKRGCLRRLTSLERLELDFESDEEVDWLAEMEEEGLFPSTLTHLDIWNLDCETIDGAKWFGHLNSLLELSIVSCHALRCLPESGLPTALETLKLWDCDALQCLPDSGLPSSLFHLVITVCPLLEKRCRREVAQGCPKFAHIGNIFIGGRYVRETKEEEEEEEKWYSRGVPRYSFDLIENGPDDFEIFSESSEEEEEANVPLKLRNTLYLHQPRGEDIVEAIAADMFMSKSASSIVGGDAAAAADQSLFVIAAGDKLALGFLNLMGSLLSLRGVGRGPWIRTSFLGVSSGGFILFDLAQCLWLSLEQTTNLQTSVTTRPHTVRNGLSERGSICMWNVCSRTMKSFVREGEERSTEGRGQG